jgi:hypothetical protein
MAAITPDEGEQWFLEKALRTALASTTFYIGLGHTADVSTVPAETDTLATITELSGSGYARQSTTFGASALNSGDYQSDAAQVTFTFSGTPSGGTATYAFFTDASSGTAGKLLGCVNLAVARSFVNLDQEKVTYSEKAQ